MFTRNLDQAERFTCAGIDFGMLLPRDLTNSVEVVFESLNAGQSTPVDEHANFDQVFYILQGSAEVGIGNETAEVQSQTVVFVPRKTKHSVRATSPTGVQYLYINIWGSGVPESEQNWKRVYSIIHDRRIADQ